MIGTGGVPEQQFSTLIPYMMEKYGKKVYIIAADYNFGQISTEWTKKLVTEAGGRDRRRGVHPARRFTVRPDHPEYSKGKTGLDDVDDRWRLAVRLL